MAQIKTMAEIGSSVQSALLVMNNEAQNRIAPAITQQALAEALIAPEDLGACRRVAELTQGLSYAHRTISAPLVGGRKLAITLRVPIFAFFPDYVGQVQCDPARIGPEVAQFVADATTLHNGYVSAGRLVRFFEENHFSPRETATHFPAIRAIGARMMVADTFPPGRAAHIQALPSGVRALVGPATHFINTASMICEALAPPKGEVGMRLE